MADAHIEQEFDHSTGDGMTDDPSALPLVYAGIVMTLLTIVSIILLAALYEHQVAGFREERIYASNWAALEKLRNEQRQELVAPRWSDAEKGVIGIPIDLAVQKFIESGGVGPAASQPAAAPAPVRQETGQQPG